MKTELRFFDVYPKVVPADRESLITIKPLFRHVDFPEKANFKITSVSRDSVNRKGHSVEVEDHSPVKFKLVKGVILIDMFFAGESEHAIRVSYCSGSKQDKSYSFRIYSLNKDLLDLRPFKGDFHIHSTGSDGRESPGYVAASCRKIGLDFMALTDHHTHESSLEAIRAMESLDTDFKCYLGEEVHPPDNPTHIINFGGKIGVCQYFREHEKKYYTEVKKAASKLFDVPSGIRFQVASCEWCFDKIRQGGGLAVFSHPYWETADRFYISEELMTQIFKRKKFDAFELIGGYYPHEMESNNLQVVRYIEERAEGNDFPVVGVSDSHGCDKGELFGWYYTVVLAKSAELEDLIAGIKGFYSVAVDAVGGQRTAVYGHLRLVKYVNFLIREYFPVHDRICAEEGKLMIDYIAGEEDAAEKISAMKGKITALMNRLWEK